MNARPDARRGLRTATAPRASVEAAAQFFQALSHPIRLGVLALLVQHGRKSAGELAIALRVEASSLSHQLRTLKDARLVVAERRGRQILYRLHDQHVARIVSDALVHVEENQR
jgi:DNA-binding transcriptional ArsR family regulator